jgi:hypothetical protein
MPTPPHVADFFPAVLAGFGLFLAGAAGLLLHRRGPAACGAGVLAGAGVAVAAATALGQPGLPAATARLIAAGLVPCLLLGSRRVTAAARCPAVRFGLLAAAGVATAVAAVAAFEREDERALDAGIAEVEGMHPPEPAAPAGRLWAATDRGTPVALRERGGADPSVAAEARAVGGLADQVIRRGPAGGRANCHGWVFAAGRFAVPADAVELVLSENGYEEVGDPRPGDLVVYRAGGRVAHTAVVRYVTDGQPTLVEGKWGTAGVFLHPVDRSVYGADYAFLRSPRDGHHLAGLDGPPEAVTE